MTGVDLADLEEKQRLSAWLNEHARRCRDVPGYWTVETALVALSQFEDCMNLETALMAFDFQI